MEEMNSLEIIKATIEEFERLQQYMLVTDAASEGYRLMKERYIVLKVMLSSFGVNVTELDKIDT